MPAVSTTILVMLKKKAIQSAIKAATNPKKSMTKLLTIAGVTVSVFVVGITVVFGLAVKVPTAMLASPTTVADKIHAYVELEGRIAGYAQSLAEKKASQLEAALRAEEESKTPSPTATPVLTPPGLEYLDISMPPSPTPVPAKPITFSRDINITTPPWRILMALDTVYCSQDFKLCNLSYIESYVINSITLETNVYRDEDANGIEYVISIDSSSSSLDDLAGNIDSKKFTKADEKIALAGSYYDLLCYFDERGMQQDNPYFGDTGSDINADDPIVTQPGCVSLPYYNQADARWNYKNGKNGEKIIVFPPDRTIKTSGCGPTSMSMIIVGLTGDSSKNPLSCMNYAVKHCYYKGAGTKPGFFGAIAEDVGLKTSYWTPTSSRIVEALQKGHPVIAIMGHGTFSKGSGHYLVLKGLTADGKVIMNDPGHRANNSKNWDMSVILGNAKGQFVECYR